MATARRPLGEHPSSADSFWHERSLEELARKQGFTQPQDLDRLIGAASDLWTDDEDFERFLAEIENRRKGLDEKPGTR